MKLVGTRALVTGGSGGIGLGIVEAFLSHGVEVLVCDRAPPDAGLAGQDDSGWRFIECDLSNTADIDRALGPIFSADTAPDILVNNVGISPKNDAAGRPLRAWTTPLEQWNDVLATNLTSYFYCSKLAVVPMLARRVGRIINISSFVARTGGTATAAHYVASKSAILGLTKVFARDATPYGVTVNAVNPGRVITPLTKDLPQKVIDSVLPTIPSRRLAVPKDIAGAVMFLASEEASYITGAALEVNGGLHMGP
jgi:3-oxoacyl-[acyl-carrier protein] reductase